ncbi:MAG: FAD-dependent oxidoreductase [Phaeodactylibacter sp.]|nr:FAD-dependent oxidoreductase [Phaeodactylibacter sp.]
MLKAEPPKIAVIGAGISGVSAAIRLQEKGYRVRILEQEAQVGGKLFTREVLQNGQLYAIDMGATVVAVSFKTVLRYIRETRSQLRAPNPYTIAFEGGRSVPLRDYYWPKGNRIALLRPFWTYLRHAIHFHRNYRTAGGYRDQLPDRYQIPFDQYCKANGMDAILPWFDLPVAAWGYGTQATLPTWYVMGEIDFWGGIGLWMTILKGKSAFVKILSDGYAPMLRHLVDLYDLEVQTGVRVNAIHRNQVGVMVSSENGNEVFDQVVLTAPGMGHLLAQPTEDESTFLQGLRYAPYATVLCRLERPFNEKRIVESGLNGVDRVRMIASPFPGCPYVVSYVALSPHTKEVEIPAIVREDLQQLDLELQQILEVRLWKHFFPHFSDFQAYRALLRAQGENRTVYAGSINVFEFSEAAASSTIHLVDRYFPPLRPAPADGLGGLKNLLYWFGQKK